MNSFSEPLGSLHEHFEALLDANAETVEPLSPQAIFELLHELNVHKIELEMQNQELRSTQLALEISQNQYFTLYEFSPVGYFRLGQNGLILEVNLAGAGLFGMEKQRLLNRGLSRFIAPLFQQSFYLHKQHALKEKVKQIVELEFIKNNGEHFFGQMESIIIDHDDAAHCQMLTSVIDVSERRQTQKELEIRVEQRTRELKQINQELQQEIMLRQQAEEKIQWHQKELAHISRLNTIGEMVSGIAHEVNQPLAAIMHYTGGCIERLRDQKQSQLIINAMKQVTKQAERAGAIVHRLKDFSKKSILQKIVIDVNEIIRETLEFVNYELRNAKVVTVLQLSEKPLFIRADKIQIEQVLINIIQNAIDAMQEEVGMKSRQLTLQTYQSTKKVVDIIIFDTGPGISSQLIAKIFNPFVTTKDKGIGIGLSISQTIIQAHDGQISVLTDTGNGAHFHISLPAERNA
jgi:PAS domain S-box-containing protein